jgi:hypothetical protein
VPLSGARFQGMLDWQTPAVSERTPLTVGLALVAADGGSLHDYRLEVEVFPRPAPAFAGLPAGILGEQGGAAWKLAEDLGLRPLPFAQGGFRLALADSPAAVEAVGPALTAFLENGGGLFCLEQGAEKGAWRIAGREVEWKFLDPCYFASRKTGHPAVAALQPFDLAWWYHPGEKRIEPTFRSVFAGADLRPLAVSAALQQPGTHLVRPDTWSAAAELPVGRGKVIFNQIEAACRVPSEPPAVRFVLDVLAYLLA